MMLTIKIFLAMTLFAHGSSLFAQDWTEQQKIAWLERNAINVRSINPANEDFSDLKAFGEIIDDAKIVLLGEQSHGDGATFHAKIRLIKFLHQKHNFGVLAFESPMFGCKKTWQQIKAGEPADGAIKKSVFGIWTGSMQFQPLVEYIENRKDSLRPLEIAGFDSQEFSLNSRTFLMSDLRHFLDSSKIDTSQFDKWNTFVSTIDQFLHVGFQDNRPDRVSESIFFEMLDRISELIHNSRTREGAFWLQLLASIKSQAKGDFDRAGKPLSDMVPKDIEYRDIQMGENLVWLSEEYYPTKKIIVWAASQHSAYNLKSINTTQYSYKNVNTMGDVVKKHLGSKVYNLGFTAYEGKGGTWMQEIPSRLALPSNGSLEDMLNHAGFKNAILDLRDIPPGGEWLRQPLLARPFAYREQLANWPQIMDGIMFIKEMYPSTKSN